MARAKSKPKARKPKVEAQAKSKAKPKPKPKQRAKPKAKPKATPERVSIGLPYASLIAQSHGELVFTASGASAFVDAKRWPPRVVVHQGQYVLYAARSVSGRWLAYTSPDAGIKTTWTLRWFDRITARRHASEQPEPVPARDFTPFYAELDESRRRAEAVHVQRLEGVDVCGERPVVVPRYVGLGERRRPYVNRDGVWAEEASLPEVEKTLAELTSTRPTRSAHLVDNTNVLVWNGRVYGARDLEFVELSSADVSLGIDDCQPVPARGGGLFALQDTRLVEVSVGSVREHLPGVSVHGFQRGPGDTLVVEASGPLLYDPAANEVAELAELVGKRAQIVGVTTAGELIVLDEREYDLRRIRPRELAKLARRRADIAPEVAPAPPVDVLDRLGAASRPTIAGAGDIVAGCTDRHVRFWAVDAVVAKVALEPIAVALRGARAAVLDVRGVLHELDATSGLVLQSRPVTDQPRSLAVTRDDRWIVIAKDAVSLVGAHEIERIEVPGALAAAANPDGAIVIVAEGRRLALWEGGDLVDIPESAEQLVAIAPLGGRRFACAGERNLFVLDLAQRELDALYEQNATPFIAASPSGRRLAWATSSRASIATITGDQLGEVESVYYPDTFSEPDDEPLRVCGLAFLDDDRFAVALSGGRGNILGAGRKWTKKLDPHPGDQRSRWVFTFGGDILIAEDA